MLGVWWALPVGPFLGGVGGVFDRAVPPSSSGGGFSFDTGDLLAERHVSGAVWPDDVCCLSAAIMA